MRWLTLVLMLLPALAWGGPKQDTLKVTADGTNLDWAATGGPTDDWDCVDEAYPWDGSTSYLNANATALVEDLALADFSPTDLSGVDSVVILLAHAEVGAGTKEVAYGVVSGATTFYGDTLVSSAGTSFIDFRGRPMTVDPNTSSAWTDGGLDALKVGFKSTVAQTSTRFSQITGIVALVYWQQTSSGPTPQVIGD